MRTAAYTLTGLLGFLLACAAPPSRPDASTLDAQSDVARDAMRDSPNDTAPPGDAASDVIATDAAHPAVVDATTLDHHVLFGYQGWFVSALDSSPIHEWRHWASSTVPAPGHLTFDAWPDLSEFAASELYPTQLHRADGSIAGLYSSFDAATVDRHVRWMRDYGIDGVFLQRFLSELADPRYYAFRDTVTEHLRDSASTYGRVFAIEYDISGANAATLVDDIERDWRHLVDDLHVTASDRYVHHRGRPVLALWGLGFTDRPGTPVQAQALLDWLTRDAPEAYRVTVVGGVPAYWRTLNNDSQTDPAWADVYRRYDVINPWLVGRFADDAGVDSYRSHVLVGDLAEAARVGADFMPVVWPGFSWSNLMPGQALNQIPRRGGTFWWKQLSSFQSAGCSMFFGAMFDEVDEGTAMFKVASHHADAPVDASFLTLDADGMNLPSDWYLRIAGAGSQMVRGEIPPSSTVPITP